MHPVEKKKKERKKARESLVGSEGTMSLLQNKCNYESERNEFIEDGEVIGVMV